MRDFLFNEAMKRLATEAATRFSALVAAGEEIPFDVAAGEGDSPFYSYVPMTGRFVAERQDELRSLPGFAPAREAVVEAGVAAAYLEARGERVPADPAERAERMLVVFFSELWEGSTGFTLDRARLDQALAALEAEARDADDADVVIVPVVGLRMPMARLELPGGVRIVRADTIEAPVEAMRSEGMGRAAWEPQFLAVAEQGGEGGAEGALLQLRELVSVMRLYKAGGIGLGPYAFAPTGAGHWARIATGAPATRPGGYRLTESEAAELRALAEALEARPDPDSALTWAVGRFEMGCERPSALEGLSDHLLALRSLLEGKGPVGASLAMRAAALIADETTDRIAARERVEDVLQLERALMSGRPTERAAELAVWAEEGVRRLLRRAALGELGEDLSAAADETLIATGLEAGDAQITVSVDDEAPAEAEEAVEDRVEAEPPAAEAPQADADVARSPEPPAEAEAPEPAAAPQLELHPPVDLTRLQEREEEEEHMEDQTRIMEPVPAEGEIKITAAPWLEEVSGGRAETIEWPAAPDRDLQHRERIDTPRVRHLFPVPDTGWEIRELDYSRRRRA